LRGAQLGDLSGTDFHRILKEVSGQSANAQWPGGGEHHSLTFLPRVIQMSLQLITRKTKKNKEKQRQDIQGCFICFAMGWCMLSLGNPEMILRIWGSKPISSIRS
jgi:hypothetical protein